MSNQNRKRREDQDFYQDFDPEVHYQDPDKVNNLRGRDWRRKQKSKAGQRDRQRDE